MALEPRAVAIRFMKHERKLLLYEIKYEIVPIISYQCGMPSGGDVFLLENGPLLGRWWRWCGFCNGRATSNWQ